MVMQSLRRLSRIGGPPLFTAQMLQDPYPTYHRLRSELPVH
jgi:hypothetical protein